MKSLIKILKNLLLIDQKLSSRNEFLLKRRYNFVFIERLLTVSSIPSVTASFYTTARNQESKPNIFLKGKIEMASRLHIAYYGGKFNCISILVKP